VSYYEFLPSEIPQSTTSRDDNTFDLSPWLRQERLYDQFSTVAIFDLLKVSDDVARFMARDRSFLDGVSIIHKTNVMRQAVEDIKNELTIYMLADVRNELDAQLGKDASMWRFWLKLDDGTCIKPKDIVDVDWTPELIEMFGRGHNVLKNLYKLTFSLSGSKDNEEERRLRRGPISLVIRSTRYQRLVRWPAEKYFSENVESV